MRTRPSRISTWGMAILVSGGLAWAEQSPDQASEGGEIVIPPHWSPYQAPNSFPEGTRLHIIVKGDTLWDLSNTYQENPFLWPQLWEANRYITDPHWIYPGDPLVIPDLDVLRAADEEPGAGGPDGTSGAEGEAGATGVVRGAPTYSTLPGPHSGFVWRSNGSGPRGPNLFPIFEEESIQCAGFVSEKEDEGFRIFESEDTFKVHIAVSETDIIYLNRGQEDGIKAGDEYYIRDRVRKIGGHGWLINTTGWLTVLAVQSQTATAQIIGSCRDILEGHYLVPFEPIPVPLVPFQEPVTRLTPETGQNRGIIIASLDDVREIGSLGRGYLVSIDQGENDGVIPGSIFTVFRFNTSRTPRKVLGELAVLTVHPKTSTALITLSYNYMERGDLVELK